MLIVGMGWWFGILKGEPRNPNHQPEPTINQSLKGTKRKTTTFCGTGFFHSATSGNPIPKNGKIKTELREVIRRTAADYNIQLIVLYTYNCQMYSKMN